MAQTLIAVVYGPSLCPLRTIVFDDDSEVSLFQANLRPQETLVTIPRSMLPPHPTVPGAVLNPVEVTIPLIAQLHSVTLVPPIRNVVVDTNGVIVDCVMADPILYQPPQNMTPAMSASFNSIPLQTPVIPTPPFTLKQHATASIGGTLIGGIYTEPVVKVAVVGPSS